MFKKFNFDYDSKNDSLFIYDPISKSKASIEMDDFVIDFNTRKEISGIELLNASDFLENLDFQENKINIKKVLNNIKDCKVDIIAKDNFYVIKLVLISGTQQRLATPLIVPFIKRSSPALARISV